MKILSEDWLTQGLMDPEYKKYILLAYIQEVKSNFQHRRLYPFLSDLVFHYNNLHRLRESKQLIYQQFPKEISKADFEQLKLHYRQIVGDDMLMQMIEEIIAFSLPRFKDSLDRGASLFEEIASGINIEPVGIAPLFNKEGYLMLCAADAREVHIYRYHITVLNRSEEKYQALNTEFLETAERTLVNGFEQIKGNLIKRFKAMPNPATFLAHAKVLCPLKETLLPITKRLLVQHLAAA